MRHGDQVFLMTFFKHPYLLICILGLTITGARGQISQQAVPPSFIEKSLDTEVPVEILRPANTLRLLSEDQIFDTIKGIPWRFGDNIDVNIHPDNSGIWEQLPNGARIWRQSVSSQGAYTLNLTFNQYRLPPGAMLFVYNQDRTMVLGAFTDTNNQEDGYFATTLVDGDFITLEYYEPEDASFRGELNLETVTHAYRNPQKYLKSFGDSGFCNLNVECPEAAGWDKPIRSIVLLLVGSNSFCSGALINTTLFDETPYILSANHCYRTPSTVVFWFNWQSPTCENPVQSPAYNSLSGATQIARHSTSDFWLMKINHAIPDEFNVYYSGWNRTSAASIDETIIGIHHPRGDIKKFSYAEEGVQSATYGKEPGSGNTHWYIRWSGGTTTEPGSSGSPIFDSNGRIIGQLHGGEAACGNTLPDWYGRFNASWTGGGTSSTRLRDWLDPLGIADQVIDGFDPSNVLVENPGNFSAFAISSSQIALKWQPNQDHDLVMIAVNDQPIFGRPDKPFVIGEEISGGGQILYFGSDTEFIHHPLDFDQEYFYKIWSYNSSLDYSRGLTDSAITPCNEFYMPFTESFLLENLPDCWGQEYVTGASDWKIGYGNNGGNPSSGYDGDTNALFRVSTISNEGNTTKLTTPVFNLYHYQQALLSFYYTNPENQGFQDVLKVYYRTAAAQPWILLQTFDSNVSSWTQVAIEFPELSSQTQIAFEAQGNRGRGVSLDKVEIITPLDDFPYVPVNLISQVINDNQVVLNWEIAPGSNEQKSSFLLAGFNIYRNGHLIYKGNDHNQISYSDIPLPVGDYTYYVKAVYENNQQSEASNETIASIISSGNEIPLNILVSGLGSTIMPPGDYLFKPASIVNLIALPHPYWYFSSWIVNGAEVHDEELLSFGIDENTVVEAVFLPYIYEVQVQSNPVGAASLLEGEGVYFHNDIAELNSQPEIGYVFLHWKEGSTIVSNNPQISWTVTDNAVFTAEFIDKEFLVSLDVSSQEAGVVSGEGSYGAGAEVHIAAVSNSGWIFKYWIQVQDNKESIVSYNPKYSFLINSNKQFRAVFEINSPKLFIATEGIGTTNPIPGEYFLDYNQEVTLKAIPDKEGSFVKWSINGVDFTQTEITTKIKDNIYAKAVFTGNTSIEESLVDNSFRVSPVPASEFLNLEFPWTGSWDIQLLSSSGQLLKNYHFNSSTQAVKNVDLTHLNNGIYILRATNGPYVLHAKILIIK